MFRFSIQRATSLLLFSVMTLPLTILAQVNEKPFTIPEIQEWEGAAGSIEVSSVSRSGSADVQRVAMQLSADFEKLFGRELPVKKGKAAKGGIQLVLARKGSMADEAYIINACDNRVYLTAATPRGLMWASRTLLQMLEATGGKSVPCGKATDAPMYSLRGFMIDCGRKYVPMSYLRNLVKVMSYYKMNTLQIHLNDNGFKQYFGDDWSKTPAAFRLESERFPGLTARDGSYTKREFVALQQLADSCGVEIIPEIDVPAHSLAFTHYRPELGSKEYGMDHLDLFNPATYTFLDSLFAEYLEGPKPVFRGRRVCIGTDEYSNAKKEVVEKFRSFTDHYLRHVESFGKQATLWGSLTHAAGSTPVKSENVVMNCWYNGYANPLDMKKAGYKLVSIPDGYLYIVPAAGYYYDYLNCKMLYGNWTPAQIGKQKFEEYDPAILGGMFAVWNDHFGNGITVKDIHHRLFPAMQTLSVKCWNGAQPVRSYESFTEGASRLSEAPGVNELGRISNFEMAEVPSGTVLPVCEAGYDYNVTFTVECKEEKKGTVMFRSPNSVFYLSDPREGKIGFERDGYLDVFNYRLPKEGKVTLTIEGTNKQTRLLVDGKERETLKALTVYAMKEGERLRRQTDDNKVFEPVVYNPGSKMYYQRTLFFPLHEAGQFKSKVSNLKVSFNGNLAY